MYRVLRPGGIFVNGDRYALDDTDPVEVLFRNGINSLLTAVKLSVRAGGSWAGTSESALSASGKIIAWCINSTGSKQYSLIKGGRPIPPDPLEASDLA